MITSKKALAVLLSQLRPFERPDPKLEQYPTDSEVAAAVLWQAKMNGDIEEKTIADFGCGTGILGIGALLLGAKYVTFIELDPRVFPVLMENIALAEELTKTAFSNYDIIEGNIEEYKQQTDVILQNPPFGTRKKGADVLFLEKAMELAPIVYSLHKTATEEHLNTVVHRQGRTISNTTRFDFPLKQTMERHTKKIERIDVCCLEIH